MDVAGIAALITALAVAYAAHLKNRLQDTNTAGISNELADLKRKVAACEKAKARLKRRPAKRRTK